MATNQDRLSTAFSFVLDDGTEVFPVKMKRQDNGKITFRVSRGGAGGNTIESTEEVDEPTMVHKALNLGYAVRCSSKDGATRGQYKHSHRAVREIRRATT